MSLLDRSRKDYFWIIVFLILGIFILPSQTIELKDYGVRSVKAGDTAMVFYANVNHAGTENDVAITARLKVEKCCLTDEQSKGTCNEMKLISGLRAILHSNEKFTLQMYYVNIDLSDLEGTCTFRLLTKPFSLSNTNAGSKQQWQQGQEFTIPFKTGSLLASSIFQKILVYTGWAKGIEKTCNHKNENEAQMCANQECQIRFGGFRSFHNKTSNLCQPTPPCDGNDKTMLSPMTGHCEPIHDIHHIHASYSPEMLHIAGDPSENATSKQQGRTLLTDQEQIVRLTPMGGLLKSLQFSKTGFICEHGKHAQSENGRPTCICDDGWRSLTAEEWEERGGLVSSEEGVPFYKLCTVPLLPHEKREKLIIIFAVLAVLTPITAIFCWVHRKKKESLEKAASLKRILDESPSSGGEKGGDGSVASEVQPAPELVVEDADAIISEITSRREPVPKHQLSGTNVEQSASNAQVEMEREVQINSSRSNMELYKLDTDSGRTNASKKWSESEISTISSVAKSKPESWRVGASPLLYNNNSRESILKSSFKTKSLLAARKPSTDELLTMDTIEKIGAHHPLTPLSSSATSNTESVRHDFVLPVIEERDNENQNASSVKRTNTFILDSMSAKKITEEKKHCWGQYIEAGSSESELGNKKPAPCSISIVDDRGAVVREINIARSLESFDNAQRNAPQKYTATGIATKVQSLPIMEYKAGAVKVQERPLMLRKGLNDECQEAYNLLTSLSNSVLDTKTTTVNRDTNKIKLRNPVNNNSTTYLPTTIRSSHSVWSNVASENATEPEPDIASRTSSFGDIRMNRIYGNTESDEDSEAALEELASSTNLTITASKNQSIAELFEQNQKLYGFPQQSPPNTSYTSIHSRTTNQSALSNCDRSFPAQAKGAGRRLQVLESDRVPSEAYVTTDSSTLASPSQSLTNFWDRSKGVSVIAQAKSPKHPNPPKPNVWPNSLSGHLSDNAKSDNNNAAAYTRGSKSTSRTRTPSPSPAESTINSHTKSAYKIKSSLQQSLKASRSRSDSSFLSIHKNNTFY